MKVDLLWFIPGAPSDQLTEDGDVFFAYIFILGREMERLGIRRVTLHRLQEILVHSLASCAREEGDK